jgi:hypothetical protein
MIKTLDDLKQLRELIPFDPAGVEEGKRTNDSLAEWVVSEREHFTFSETDSIYRDIGRIYSSQEDESVKQWVLSLYFDLVDLDDEELKEVAESLGYERNQYDFGDE